MALTDEGTNTTMLVQPSGFMGNYGGGFGNFGGDWAWILLLLLIGGNGCGFGGWGGGYGGMMYEFPWLLNGQNMINANTNAGFDHAATQSAIAGLQNSVTSGFGDIATQLCGGFAGVNASIANGFAQAEIANNARQIADMQQMFGVQSALQNCCCENRAGIADLRYTVATEACADRAAVSDALRDVIAANTASTQRILDQLCQDKIDAKNDTIAQLRQELMFARGQASQDVQTAQILAGQASEIDGIYNRLSNCPVPSVPVYGRQNIFTCNNNNCGCGCGNGSF